MLPRNDPLYFDIRAQLVYKNSLKYYRARTAVSLEATRRIKMVSASSSSKPTIAKETAQDDPEPFVDVNAVCPGLRQSPEQLEERRQELIARGFVFDPNTPICVDRGGPFTWPKIVQAGSPPLAIPVPDQDVTMEEEATAAPTVHVPALTVGIPSNDGSAALARVFKSSKDKETKSPEHQKIMDVYTAAQKIWAASGKSVSSHQSAEYAPVPGKAVTSKATPKVAKPAKAPAKPPVVVKAPGHAPKAFTPPPKAKGSSLDFSKQEFGSKQFKPTDKSHGKTWDDDQSWGNWAGHQKHQGKASAPQAKANNSGYDKDWKGKSVSWNESAWSQKQSGTSWQSADFNPFSPCARSECNYFRTWHKTHCCASCMSNGSHGQHCAKQITSYHNNLPGSDSASYQSVPAHFQAPASEEGADSWQRPRTSPSRDLGKDREGTISWKGRNLELHRNDREDPPPILPAKTPPKAAFVGGMFKNIAAANNAQERADAQADPPPGNWYSGDNPSAGSSGYSHPKHRKSPEPSSGRGDRQSLKRGVDQLSGLRAESPDHTRDLQCRDCFKGNKQKDSERVARYNTDNERADVEGLSRSRSRSTKRRQKLKCSDCLKRHPNDIDRYCKVLNCGIELCDRKQADQPLAPVPLLQREALVSSRSPSGSRCSRSRSPIPGHVLPNFGNGEAQRAEGDRRRGRTRLRKKEIQKYLSIAEPLLDAQHEQYQRFIEGLNRRHHEVYKDMVKTKDLRFQTHVARLDASMTDCIAQVNTAITVANTVIADNVEIRKQLGRDGYFNKSLAANVNAINQAEAKLISLQYEVNPLTLSERDRGLAILWKQSRQNAEVESSGHQEPNQAVGPDTIPEPAAQIHPYLPGVNHFPAFTVNHNGLPALPVSSAVTGGVIPMLQKVSPLPPMPPYLGYGARAPLPAGVGYGPMSHHETVGASHQ